MKKIFYYNLIIPIILIALISNCTQQSQKRNKEVDLKTQVLFLKKMILDTLGDRSYTNISLIKTYKTHQKCSGDDRFVNLYICRNDNSKDTLLVFEACRPVPDYLKEDSKFKNTLSIAKDDVLKKFPDSVFVDLPTSVKISTNSKFVFARLLPLEE